MDYYRFRDSIFSRIKNCVKRWIYLYSKVSSEFERWGRTFCSAKILTKFLFTMTAAPLSVTKKTRENLNLVKILAEQYVRAHLSNSDATLRKVNFMSIFFYRVNKIAINYIWHFLRMCSLSFWILKHFSQHFFFLNKKMEYQLVPQSECFRRFRDGAN